IRQPVGQLALVGALQHPVRRVQAVRAGLRARAGRTDVLHRNQERLLCRTGGRQMDLGQRPKDKVAVVTGGASGIGLATAKRMQAEGAIVVIGDVDASTGKSVANDMNVTFVQVDVADQVAVDHLFDTAFEVHGGVDIAFNNAGISPPEDDLIENTGVDAWDRVQDINLKSVFFCCKAALRYMVPAQKGSIINTASFVAVMGSATSQISYTASKGGVL